MIVPRKAVTRLASRSLLSRQISQAAVSRLPAAGLFLSSPAEAWSDLQTDSPMADLPVEGFCRRIRRDYSSLVLGAENRGTQVHLKALVHEVVNRGASESERLGALILSNSVEQSIELYRELRLLSAGRSLRLSRLGSASYLAPQIGAGADSRSLAEAAKANLRRVAEDEQLDVLIATPGQLALLPKSARIFNPRILLVEDFELQFLRQTSNEADSILESIGSDTHIIWASRNESPALPSYLTQWFAELDCVAQEVTVPVHRTSHLRVEKKNKLSKALELLRTLRNKKGVLVCRDPEQAALLKEAASRQQVRNFILTSSRRAPPRVWNLLSFQSSSSSLLITEPRAMRTLDLSSTDFAIFLDECTSPLEEYYAVRSLAEATQIFKFIEL